MPAAKSGLAIGGMAAEETHYIIEKIQEYKI